MALTPYMQLDLPTVSVTPGPEYATENNTAFSVVDAHDHTSGKGTTIPTLGININADLSFGAYNAVLLRSTRYNNQLAPLALASDLNCIFFSGGELYANDASGNHVKITDGGAVNVSGSGNITGMGATTATVVYTSGNQTFTFSSNTNVKAFLSAASVSIATNVASADSVTLASGTLSGGAYTLTLPTAVASTNTAVLVSSNAGVLSYLTLGAANSFLQVNALGTALEYISTPITFNGSFYVGGISGALVSNSVSNPTDLVLGANLYLGGGSGLRLVASSTNLIIPGDLMPSGTGHARLSGSPDAATLRVANNAGTSVYPIVVSPNPSSLTGLFLMRGQIANNGVKDSGEGFTSAKTGAGTYRITFTTPFVTTPVGTGSTVAGLGIVVVGGVTTTVIDFQTYTIAGALSDAAFQFVLVGERPN